jgi:hypothetical protein
MQSRAAARATENCVRIWGSVAPHAPACFHVRGASHSTLATSRVDTALPQRISPVEWRRRSISLSGTAAAAAADSMSQEKLDEVIGFAIERHGSQRYGDKPYAYHLKAVADVLERGGHGRDLLAVAWLHDVVEDTVHWDWDKNAVLLLDEIERRFGRKVRRCVDLVTSGPRGRHENWTLVRLTNVRATDEEAGALIVKAADRLANITQCIADRNREKLSKYLRIHEAFEEAVRRPGLCPDIWQEMDRLVGPYFQSKREFEMNLAMWAHVGG